MSVFSVSDVAPTPGPNGKLIGIMVVHTYTTGCKKYTSMLPSPTTPQPHCHWLQLVIGQFILGHFTV